MEPPAWADDVRLTNGDRITGTIKKMRDNNLTLTTSHSGDIKRDTGNQ